jgi:hypothetical protein
MPTPALDREEEWIAKYRAALDAFPIKPQRPSLFDQLDTICDNVGPRLAFVFWAMFVGITRTIHRVRPSKNKKWIVGWKPGLSRRNTQLLDS